ncbi:hypothetical protein ACGFX2_08445 [Streptomyces goshikiensis]
MVTPVDRERCTVAVEAVDGAVVLALASQAGAVYADVSQAPGPRGGG